MNRIDVVELGADHPAVSDFLIHAKTGLQRSRILEIVRGAGEAGLQERIRRGAGYRRDGVGSLRGSEDRQVAERDVVQIHTGRLENLIHGLGRRWWC